MSERKPLDKKHIHIVSADESLLAVKDFKWFKYDDVVSAIQFAKHETITLCNNCHTKWFPKISKCEKCNSENVEHYIMLEDFDEAFRI